MKINKWKFNQDPRNGYSPTVTDHEEDWPCGKGMQQNIIWKSSKIDIFFNKIKMDVIFKKLQEITTLTYCYLKMLPKSPVSW